MMFDFRAINTDVAKSLSDKQLLGLIDHMEFPNGLPSGWGLVAELCKRFERILIYISDIRDEAKYDGE
jgi:hypothetical protein